jgi:hypothetical protein
MKDFRRVSLISNSMTLGEVFLMGDFSVISLNILLQISSSDCA